MRELLTSKWGMGPHLADAVMSVWGGQRVFGAMMRMLELLR